MEIGINQAQIPSAEDCMAIKSFNEDTGIIGESYENGMPVIYAFENEMPDKRIRERLTWLTVISWKYDGIENNGMPLPDENKQMIALVDVLDNKIEQENVVKRAYSSTGSNLKEFVYYVHDRNLFLKKLNKELSQHPRYPIEIKFYEDEEWDDFKQVLNKFTKNNFSF